MSAREPRAAVLTVIVMAALVVFMILTMFAKATAEPVEIDRHYSTGVTP